MTRPQTILYIDDDDDLLKALTMALESQGYRVLQAQDGEQGLSVLEREQPDLILLDLMMPIKNGFQFGADLRQSRPTHKIPIVAMTAFGQNIGEIHGMEPTSNGWISEFLEKPVEINVLLSRIRSLLAARPASA